MGNEQGRPVKTANISEPVKKEGELIDDFNTFLQQQAKVLTPEPFNVPALSILDKEDKIAFEEILELYENYKSDTRAFTIKVRNKLEYILHLYHHKATPAKIQTEIQILNEIIVNDYSDDLFVKAANKIKVKCENFKREITSKPHYSKKNTGKRMIKAIVLIGGVMTCLLVGAAGLAVVCVGAIILLGVLAPAVFPALAGAAFTGGVGAVIAAGALGPTLATGVATGAAIVTTAIAAVPIISSVPAVAVAGAGMVGVGGAGVCAAAVGALIGSVKFLRDFRGNTPLKEIQEIENSINELQQKTEAIKNGIQELNVTFTDEDLEFIVGKLEKMRGHCEEIIKLTG